jgi:hypothetical protein
MRELHLNLVDIRKEILYPQIQGVTMSWPSEECLSLVEVQLSGLLDPC